MEEKLEEEFDSVFEGDEAVDMFLKLTSDSFTRRVERVQLSTIGYTQPIKLGRKDTVSGLTTSIKDIGVVSPIHVMTVEEEAVTDDYKYILIDGLRRVYGALKNGIKELDAVVWDFEDKERGMELALVISLILNRTQRHDWKETWDLYRILEMQHSNITPGILEYLLQLEGGDAMKLKDVMMCEYDDVKETLLNNEKSLEACYKMLQKKRKEEDQLYNDDMRGVSDIVEDAEDIVSDNTEDGGNLSDDDVRELLEMSENMDDMDISSDDFNELNQSEFGDEQQRVGERHPLDPALKSAVLSRDDFKCQCCGFGGAAALGVLAVHHKLPVHVGGKDTLENLTTLCLNHHILVHVAERNGGKLQMTEEDFKGYSEEEQLALKKVLVLAKVAVEADKRRGLSREQVKESTTESVRHPMPGAGLSETRQAYNESHR